MFTAPVGYLAFELSLVNNEEFLGMERESRAMYVTRKIPTVTNVTNKWRSTRREWEQ